jgi:hypothetical protein
MDDVVMVGHQAVKQKESNSNISLQTRHFTYFQQIEIQDVSFKTLGATF